MMYQNYINLRMLVNNNYKKNTSYLKKKMYLNLLYLKTSKNNNL